MRRSTVKQLDAWISAAEDAKQATTRNDPGETMKDIRRRTGWGEIRARREIARMIETGRAKHSGYRGREKTYELVKK